MVALSREEAHAYFTRELADNGQRAHERSMEALQRTRSNFRDRITLREGIPSNDPVARTLRAGELVDEVTIDGEVVELYAGRGKRYIEAEIERRFPEPAAAPAPDFAAWWESTKSLLKIWRAELLKADTSERLNVVGDERGSAPFPVRFVLQELDRLERRGWNIIHVSEDRGVDQTVGAGNEAYVVSARYLVTNNNSIDANSQ